MIRISVKVILIVNPIHFLTLIWVIGSQYSSVPYQSPLPVLPRKTPR